MATVKRSPGAPIGNKNALKHGLYSSILSSPTAPSLDDFSLISEISLLRVLLDSFIANTYPIDISTLDTISAICLRISSIYKVHSLVVGPSFDISDIISQSISEVFPDVRI